MNNKSSVSLVAALTFLSQSVLAASLEEVIVTAQKREENVQQVPVAVTALGQQFLEDRQLTSIEGLSSVTPNLRVQNTPGDSTGAQIAIRGGVTINPALAWEPAVGVYLDGVYIGKTQGSVFDAVDLQRVEVLRGPQGTLYGRNTLAGAINLITAKPTGDFGGSAKVQAGNYGLLSERVAVNLPALGPLKVKLSGVNTRRDGFIDVVPSAIAPNPDTSEMNSAKSHSGRAVFVLDLSDNLQAEYAFDFSRANQKPRYGQPVAGAPLAAYSSNSYQDKVTIDSPVMEKTKTQGHAMTLNWDLDTVAFKSITALRKMNAHVANDYDGTELPLVWAARIADYKSWSQEFQATGDLDKFEYVAGLFYFQDRGSEHNDPFGGPGIFGVFRQDSQTDIRTKTYAAYGQLSYDVTDDLTLSLGLRYTHEKKELDKYLATVAPFFLVQIPDGTSGEKSFHNLSPALIANYAVSESLNVYGKWSRGFKSGGFNSEASNVADTLLPYDAEKVDAFEIGAKSDWLEHRVQVNTAAFLNKSQDMQLATFTGGNGLSSQVTNAGKATTWGFEVEAIAQATDDLQLRLTYAYLHPEYDRFIDADAITGVICDVSNDRVFPLAPKNTYSASIDWTLLRTDFGNYRMVLDADHTDSYYLYPYSKNPAADQVAANNKGDARTLLNARLALENVRVGSTTLEFALWGKNLTDKEYVATTLDFGPALASMRQAYYGDPRTYGIDIAVKW